MNIISWNVNGLRAVYQRDFVGWAGRSDADIICLQEIKLQESQLPAEIAQLEGYHVYGNYADKKGYSGVAVFSRTEPLLVKHHLGHEQFDREGRMLHLEFSDFILLNLYMPHGGRMKEKLSYKLECYQRLFEYIQALGDRPMIMMGDFNIAHTEYDLARPQWNKDNIMFTPTERKQLDTLLSLGFVDSFRRFYPDEPGHHTWWPYLEGARERNIGWRIDYGFASSNLTENLQDAAIESEVTGSDHCPVSVRLA